MTAREEKRRETEKEKELTQNPCFLGSNDWIQQPPPLILDNQRREIRTEPYQISIHIIPFPQFLRLVLSLRVELLWGLVLLES